MAYNSYDYLTGGLAVILLMIVSNITKRYRTKKIEATSITKINPRYLTVGAIYFQAHGSNVYLLRSTLSNCTVKKLLKRDWGIRSREDAIRMIELGIEGDIQASDYDLSIEQLKKELVYDRRSKSKKFKENQQQNQFLNKVATCTTTIAWDFERAAQVVRYVCTIGYIDEKEANEYLKTIHFKTSESFNDWHEYGASFYVGRTIWRGGSSLVSDEIEVSFKKLLNDSSSIWHEYPLLTNL